jgi:uncharacterized protein YegL
VVEPKSSILVVYFVADQSGSIGRNIDVLNAGLASLREAVQRQSSAAANVRLSVIGFSDTAFTNLEPADVTTLSAMPALTAQSVGSYAAAFDELAHRITVDIPSLEAQGYTVGQPAVFFVTGGPPNGGKDWRDVRANLLDEPAAPAIVAFGMGDADAGVVSEVATKPHFAFVSARGGDVATAIPELLTVLAQSVISSGQAIASGSTVLHVDKPDGFNFAGDAPIPNRPPPQISTPQFTPVRPIPASERQPSYEAPPPQTAPPATTKGPSGQGQGGFFLAGLALLAIAVGEVAQLVITQVLGPPLPGFLVNVAIVMIALIGGVTVAVRSGQSRACIGMFVVAMIVGLVAVPNVLHFATRPRPSSYSRPSATSPTTAPSTAPPVAEGALEGLLLSSDQINTTMGVTGMAPKTDTTTMNDSSASTSAQACVVMNDAGEATVYANSGWTATRVRMVAKPHYGSMQAVVLFSSAHDASAFFTISTRSWPGCSNREFTGGSDTFTVGPVSNVDAILSVSMTGDASFHCERALTVANNVAIDIATCGVPGSAVNIAHQIAAKILTE